MIFNFGPNVIINKTKCCVSMRISNSIKKFLIIILVYFCYKLFERSWLLNFGRAASAAAKEYKAPVLKKNNSKNNKFKVKQVCLLDDVSKALYTTQPKNNIFAIIVLLKINTLYKY
ncbi:hypothetical protein BpHYR1_037276 [Brachionus plicatilis]|uniref:Uncharacterized protein n=1 Tax=Brachionus plicatilis TaxID=10195 RepID=A0A3M7QLC7_BRAPC|nr:hypothetical protein BpHYR1_037276 [Brachionus plicatilis]